VNEQGLSIKQEHDPPGIVMLAGIALSPADAQQFAAERAYFRSLSFGERWAMADRPRAKRSDALRAAEMALYEAEAADAAEYLRSGQADADARAYREAQFDQRMRAAKGVRRVRARARGAGRPAGRSAARRESGSQDDADDSDGESDPAGVAGALAAPGRRSP
jgi:hypothetical protein